MSSTIYALCESFTGEVRYVGKTSVGVEKRLKRHIQNAASGKFHVHRWLRSLNSPPHIRVLEENPTDINEAEMKWIAFYREKLGERLCNLTLGGDGGVPTKETRAKISAALKGKMSATQKAIISATHKGKIVSSETRAKTSAANKGHAMSENNKEKLLTANIGRSLSVEHKAKIGNASRGNTHRLGCVHTAETRAKTSAALIGHTVSPETKAKMSFSAKNRGVKVKKS